MSSNQKQGNVFLIPSGMMERDKSRPNVFVIPDSREGWVASVRLLIESYTKNGAWHTFDYSVIRPEGSPIKGFGGTASGPAPLQQLHMCLEKATLMPTWKADVIQRGALQTS